MFFGQPFHDWILQRVGMRSGEEDTAEGEKQIDPLE
jgi:hypothetical protein